MELKKENFRKLVQLADTMPRLNSIMVKYRIVKVPVGEHRVLSIQRIETDAIIFGKKINEFIKGEIPDLSLAERKKIRNFLPFRRQLQIHSLSIQVMNDITENAENTSDQSQLRRYLQNMADELEPIVSVIKEIARIDEFNFNNMYPYPLNQDLTLEQKESKELLLELLLRDNVFFYETFREVKDHINHIRHEEGFINLDKEYHIENSKLLIPKEPINTLVDAVKSNDALNQIYTLLIDAKLIDKDTKIFKDSTGGNKGHFYSTIISFNEKGYFKRKPHRSEYLNICNNTFNADIKESTARNNKTRPATTLTIPPFTLTD